MHPLGLPLASCWDRRSAPPLPRCSQGRGHAFCLRREKDCGTRDAGFRALVTGREEGSERHGLVRQPGCHQSAPGAPGGHDRENGETDHQREPAATRYLQRICAEEGEVDGHDQHQHLLPTYGQAGLIAPLLLVLLRLAQGLSVGGEYTTSGVFLVEQSEPKHRGFLGSFAIDANWSGSGGVKLTKRVVPRH